MTTEDLMKLRELAEAAHSDLPVYGCKWLTANALHLNFGLSRKAADYVGSIGPAKVIELLDALEAQGREVVRLTESLRYEVDCVAAIGGERDTLSAELAAIRATDKDAGLVADAARYRVLRDDEYQHHEDDISVADRYFDVYFGKELDEAVDALKARHDTLLAASPKIGGV